MGYRKSKKSKRRNSKGENNNNVEEREKKRKLYEESQLHSQKMNEDYTPIEQRNLVMEAYYDYQGLHNTRLASVSTSSSSSSCGSSFELCSSYQEKQKEKELFFSTIKSILPASFRIGQDCPKEFRDAIAKDVQAHVGQTMDIVVESSSDTTTTTTTTVQPAKPIPFLPDAYQLSVDRRTIRRNPRLSEFHDWLKIQTNAGFLTRQETVSMIPPVVLGVQPHHIVLDMCAAPGSKTCQLLEIVSSSLDQQQQREPLGFVVANDVDSKRAYMLVHQLRRINSPAIFVTSCDAQFFPSIEPIFDRVLADVPCSGDGTIRKNPGIWKKWNPLGSFSLHGIQLNIALSGARLTKVGGYLCYSTCSMNPIENEAVVAELLRLTKGSLILVEKHLPGLVVRPGLHYWKVLSAKGKKRIKGKQKPKMIAKRKQWAVTGVDNCGDEPNNIEQDLNGNQEEIEDEEDDDDGDDDVEDENNDIAQDETTKNKVVLEGQGYWEEENLRQNAIQQGLIPYDTFENVPELQRNRIRKSCFPPTAEECSTMHLERCMRCLPQDMDTGGFFIALFQKISTIGAKATKKAARQQAATDSSTSRYAVSTDANNSAETNSNELVLAKEDSGNSDFVQVDEALWPSLSNFYGFSDDFPKDQFMSRECGKAKVIYFISKAIKEQLIDKIGIQQKALVINSGLRAFERNSKECDVAYRVTQEGIHYIAPYMNNRFFVVNAQDFCTCMKPGGIWIGNFSTDFQNELKTLSPGSFVVSLAGFEKDVAKKMFLVMWRCRGDALNCLVAKVEQLGIESKLRALGLLVTVPELKKKHQSTETDDLEVCEVSEE